MRRLIEKVEREALTEGYSHYWEHEGFDDRQWAKLNKEVRGIIAAAEKAGIKIAGPVGTGKPVFSDKLIVMNGSDGDDYETFAIKKSPQSFAAVKTGERPYDAVVVSILAAAKKINKTFRPRSDGGPGAIKRIY